jgi:imidazole glycerol phosphate synthase subunit HisF
MFKTVAQLLVKDGLAVQSQSFGSLIPLGRVDIALEALNYLNPDEICILDLDGDIEKTLINNTITINEIKLPICIGGGSNSALLKRFAIERLIKNSAVFGELYDKSDSSIGRQALIAYLPYKLVDKNLYIYNSNIRAFTKQSINFLYDILNVYSEIILMDANGQGIKDGFDEKIFDYIPETIVSRIYLSGGMNKLQISHSRSIGYAGVIIDNTSLYKVLNICERYFDAV